VLTRRRSSSCHDAHLEDGGKVTGTTRFGGGKDQGLLRFDEIHSTLLMHCHDSESEKTQERCPFNEDLWWYLLEISPSADKRP
jgi:hypothetical protein